MAQAAIATLLVGCGVSNHTIPSRTLRPPPRESLVASEITSGTRRKHPYGDGWDVDIQVFVKGTGPAFGGYDSTTIYLSGSEHAEDRNRIIIPINVGTGWPTEYEAKAEYNAITEDAGEVVVTVEVRDTSHSAYEQRVYRATHPIQWHE